ncbi:MAG: ATP-dependent DNA helicase RecG [Anaerolineaceae bacterium]|nr:ATP-dependent DNA helicase RecG [Anaerolineaceae bacterium]
MSELIIKIKKVLILENQRGFDNMAVVGGMDKILLTWNREAETNGNSSGILQKVLSELQEYQNIDINSRSELIKSLLAKLNQISEDLSSEKSFPREADKFSQEMEEDTSSIEPKSINLSRTLPQPEIKKNTELSNLEVRDTSKSINLDAPVTVLSGIGDSSAERLKSLDISTLGELLFHFPKRYDDYSKLKTINRLEFGEEITLIGSIKSIDTRDTKNKKFILTEAVLTDGTGFLRLIWFNQPFISRNLRPETQVVVSGKIDMYLGRLVINNPEWERLEKEHLHTNRIVPVYPLTAKVKQRWLRRILHKIVNYWVPRIKDYMPEKILSSLNMIDLSTALFQIHFPDTIENLHAARKRLAFDEIFLLQIGLLQQKQEWKSAEGQKFAISDDDYNNNISKLPFQLTNAQLKALCEIRSDLASGSPMTRLLQGDVGSGKTVIAALAAAIITKDNAQGAIMAPTSILAEQHFANFKKLLAFDTGGNILDPHEIRLLIGNTPEAERNEIHEGLLNGTIKILIGTHALIESPVNFKNLQFVVIDEQHRFGVKQRALLRSKGKNPHLLVMTATPIPRSLALTVFGDLDLSVIDEMPVGRIPIETHVIHPAERERAYRLINSQVEKGHQAFIIYPLIEQGDSEDNKAAVEEHQRLQNEVFPKLRLGLLHGRLKSEEKEKIMNNFRNGGYHILISTSVVEVGLDVPNATMMLIESANRFGLAQLHQFRGRVGRGDHKSYCILIPEDENSLQNERLSAMANTNDGFILAESDLAHRGPGDFLGTRQSGLNKLKLASITDNKLIELARKHALMVFDEDPNLSSSEHQDLRETINRFWNISTGELSL